METGGRTYVRITRARYASLRAKRFHYLLIYGFIFFAWASIRIAEARGIHIPPSFSYVILACQALFTIQFASVLLPLGFHLFWVFLLCLVTIPPVPGLLILGAADRRIYKMLDQARELLEAAEAGQEP